MVHQTADSACSVRTYGGFFVLRRISQTAAALPCSAHVPVQNLLAPEAATCQTHQIAQMGRTNLSETPSLPIPEFPRKKCLLSRKIKGTWHCSLHLERHLALTIFYFFSPKFSIAFINISPHLSYTFCPKPCKETNSSFVFGLYVASDTNASLVIITGILL